MLSYYLNICIVKNSYLISQHVDLVSQHVDLVSQHVDSVSQLVELISQLVELVSPLSTLPQVNFFFCGTNTLPYIWHISMMCKIYQVTQITISWYFLFPKYPAPVFRHVKYRKALQRKPIQTKVIQFVDPTENTLHHFWDWIVLFR